MTNITVKMNTCLGNFMSYIVLKPAFSVLNVQEHVNKLCLIERATQCIPDPRDRMEVQVFVSKQIEKFNLLKDTAPQHAKKPHTLASLPCVSLPFPEFSDVKSLDPTLNLDIIDTSHHDFQSQESLLTEGNGPVKKIRSEVTRSVTKSFPSLNTLNVADTIYELPKVHSRR